MRRMLLYFSIIFILGILYICGGCNDKIEPTPIPTLPIMPTSAPKLTSIPSPTENVGEGIEATVLMGDGSTVQVVEIQLKETARGPILGEYPIAYRTNIYYTISKSGVEVQNAIPFEKIKRIDIQLRNLSKEESEFAEQFGHNNTEVGKITIYKRDGEKIVCNIENSDITIVKPDGMRDQYECAYYYVWDVCRSGEKFTNVINGPPIEYEADGFVGKGMVDDIKGEWSSDFCNIKSIIFD